VFESFRVEIEMRKAEPSDTALHYTIEDLPKLGVVQADVA